MVLGLRKFMRPILKNIFLFTIILAFAFIHASCATPAPKRDISIELQKEEEGARAAFNLGEDYYKKGEADLAIFAFKKFISRYPKSKLADVANLRIGDAYFSKKEHESAANYYKKIVEMLPRSDFFSEARYKLGVCNIELNKLDDALLLLSEESKLPNLPERKSAINKYLADIYALKKDYLSAIKSLTAALNEAKDEIERNNIRQRVKRIIDENIDNVGLKDLARLYPASFPGDTALINLIKHYVKVSDYANAERSLKEFIASFPKHEFAPEADRLLKDMKAMPKIGKKIGVLVPLTGRLADFGKDVLNGIKLSVDEYNAKKGAEPVVLVVKDTASEPEKTQKAFEELVSVDRVTAIIGPVSNKEVEAVAPRLDSMEMPVITPSAYAAGLPGLSKYLFRNALTNELQARAISGYAVNKLNLKRFVIIHPDDAYGADLKNLFIKEVEKLNGEIIHSEAYNPEAVDFGEQMKRIKEEDLKKYGIYETTKSEKEEGKEITVYKPGFDAVFIPADYSKVILITPQLALYDIKGVTLLGTNGWNSNDLIQLGERYVDGAIFVDAFFIDSPRPIVKDFVKRYRFKYEQEPTFLSAQAYDTAEILMKVLKEGAISGKDIRDALLKIKDFEGVTGRTSFNQDGEVDKNLFIITVKRRKFVEVK